MRTLIVIAALILSFSFYSCTVDGDFLLGDDVKAIKKESKSFNASQIQVVEVQNSNGDIITSVSDDDTIEVRIEKWATGHDEEDATDNLNDVKVIIDESDSGRLMKIEVVYSNHFGADYGCDIDVSLPESIAVDLRSSNGRIEVYDVQEDIDCHTSNGAIVIAGTSGDATLRTSNSKITVENHYGDLDAETSNSQIDADMVLPKNGSCRLKTSNSSIKLSIPNNTSATITASTSNSNINVYDLDIETTQKNKTKLKGVLGDGDGEITLETSNSSITISGNSGDNKK